MYKVMMTKDGSTKIINFMIHGAGVLVQGRGHISDIVKLHYVFKILLLYFQAWIKQTISIQYIMMTKEGSTLLGVLVLRYRLISHIVKMQYFF